MPITPVVQYFYHSPQTLTDKGFGDFKTTASIIPPDYTLTSTATLTGTQFSHNNYVLECWLLRPNLDVIKSSKTIVIEGMKHACNCMPSLKLIMFM